MTTALWAVAAAVAALWPGRLAGPLDGAPLDGPLEALVIGVMLPWLLISNARILRRPAARALIVALLAWKAVTGAALTQDGWCVRFTSPTPLYLDDVLVPHSWDVRADWRAEVPRCSAVMTESYPVLERFPVWFYNLPPANYRDPVRAGDRPPGAVLRMDLEGFLQTRKAGALQIIAGEDVALGGTVDGQAVSHEAISAGISLGAGSHQARITGALRNTHWSLDPRWDGRPLWTAAVATVDPPSAVDLWFRPWGRFVPALLVLSIALLGVFDLFHRLQSVIAVASAVALAATFAVAASLGREPVTRALPAISMLAAAVILPRRLQNLRGFSLFVALPFLAIFMVLGAAQAGIFTWFSAGDDWWMFQRFAYRIYMQGFWLQGGEATFWFQPFYRWVAGALHLVFGDSSVGELFWDTGAALAGSAFAFHVTKTVAGFRWGLAAAAITLAVFTLGPSWYMFGRGLSEFTSAGFLYGGALFAMRGRSGYWPAIVVAGILVTLSFYTRMNNLPMAVAVAAFALPTRLPVDRIWSPIQVWRSISKPVVAGVLGAVAIGLHLFTLRTWYYTGIYSMLHGTSTSANTVWKLGESLIGSWASSVLMVLTMNDPARFDVRAIPLLIGFTAAVLGLARVRPFARLPLPVVVLCMAGISGALVVRGSTYSGRFSIHMVPATVTLAVSAVALLLNRDRAPRSLPPAPRSPGTT
jgi:hypothetical protein